MSQVVAVTQVSKSQSTVGLRAVLRVLEKWQASSEQSCQILRISRSTYTRALQREGDWSVSLDADQLQRISLVLNIHSALRVIFDNPENVYGFVTMANHNEFFNGRSPLEVMVQGDMISLYETFRRIDALRGAGW